MYQHRAAPNGVRYCEILNCAEPAQRYSRCGRHIDMRVGSNGPSHNTLPHSLSSPAYERNGIAKPTAKRTAVPRFTLKSHPAPSLGSSGSHQRPRQHGLSAPAVAYPLGGGNNASLLNYLHSSPAGAMTTSHSPTIESGHTPRAAFHESGRTVSKSGLRAPLMQPSPSWNGPSHSDNTPVSGTEERRLQHATSYRSPIQQEPTPKEHRAHHRPETPPTDLKSLPNLAPTAFLKRAIRSSPDSYLTKSHVTNGTGDTISNGFSPHQSSPAQNPVILAPIHHHIRENQQQEHQFRQPYQQLREQQLREQRVREQQQEHQFRQQQLQEQQLSQQRQYEQQIREQQLHEQQARQHREWVKKQAELQQKEWRRLEQETHNFHHQIPTSLRESVVSDSGSNGMGISPPSVESIIIEERSPPVINANGKRPAPAEDAVVKALLPTKPAQPSTNEARPQPVRSFDSEAFDAMIYGTVEEVGTRVDERDEFLWLPLNPGIHRPYNRSERWLEAKAQEIQSRPRRKAWFGKVGARIHWLRRQQQSRSRMQEAARRSGTIPPRKDPKPVGFSRAADLGLIEGENLPEDIQANAAWSSACAWHRQSLNQRTKTQRGMQGASTLAWTMYKQIVEHYEASTQQHNML